MRSDRREGRSDDGRSSLARHIQSELLALLRDMAIVGAVTVIIGLLLFAMSGAWPPLVAVESGSMEPHMHRGDMVFVTSPERFAPGDAFRDTGVVTAETGRETDYRSFAGDGSVIVYRPPGYSGSPVIHRARFWVTKGENWFDEANPDHLRASNCRELRNCPAPHAGFITKGDANARYDQAGGISEPVRPEWIQGVARVQIPHLGWIRLGFAAAFG